METVKQGTSLVWSLLRFFTPFENWGDASRIDFLLLKKLDDFRAYIKEPIWVLCGTQGTHVVDSFHYKGQAVDICFPTMARKLFDYYLAVERFSFNGVGVYPFWQYKNSMIGGLHLDVRDLQNKPGARWLGVKGENNTTSYQDLNSVNLHKYKVI